MSNIAGIIPVDIADGIGVRVGVFLSGCPHRCPNCFNSEAWDRDYGKPLTQEIYSHLNDLLKLPYIRGITILGGEPLTDYNAEATSWLCFLARANGKDVWVYTGYTWEELQQRDLGILWEDVDVLVDGRFVQSLADKRLAFRGSSNQRIIDVQKTIKGGEIVLWEGQETR